eukprot:g3695.t1
MGGKNGGGKNAGGKGASNKGKGKKQQFEGRMRKVETMAARFKAWFTFSCRGFGCKPCHVWKKQKLQQYANQGEDGSEERDDAYPSQPGEAGRASGSKDVNSRGYEGASNKELQRKMSKFSPSPKTKNKGAEAAEAAEQTQIIASSQHDMIEPTNLDLKLAEEQYGDIVTPDFWKADVMTTVIDKLVEQKVTEGDEKHVLRLTKLENGRQTRERSWLEAQIALLHKAGKKSDPANYRPIALLTAGEKILAVIILRRIKDQAYRAMDKRQKGSVRGYSCRHAVFQLIRDMEEAVRTGEVAAYTFIDFKKAYDSLDWDRMRGVLKKLGMPAGLGKIIKGIYDGASLRLKLGRNKRSSRIEQASGIRQGSSLSPLLFVLCLGFAMLQFGKTMQEEKHWTAEEAETFALTWLGFVDDLVTKGRSEEEAQFALQELAAACRFVGLELNTKKTEAMSFGLLPAKRDNEHATMERFYDEEGERGWLVEYDGIDLRPEWKEKARQVHWKTEQGRPTHWLAWDGGRVNCCAYGCKGWVHTDRGEKFRITRLGMKQYVMGERSRFVCPRCGDVLADAKALVHHQGSGFCRIDKTDQQLRQLRIGRRQEERQKVDRGKRPVVPARLSTQDGEVGTVGAFKYLGTLIDNAGRTGGEITRRAGIATSTVGQLRRIWRCRGLRPELKTILYESLVASVALYNAETWTITAADWGVLRRFQLSTLRTVAGAQAWTHTAGEAESHTAEQVEGAQETEEEEDRTSRWELCTRLGIAPIEEAVREKRVVWAAHALRDAGAEGSGERIQREHARKTEWGKQLAADLEHYGLSLAQLQTTEAAAIRELLEHRIAAVPTFVLAAEGGTELDRIQGANVGLLATKLKEQLEGA